MHSNHSVWKLLKKMLVHLTTLTLVWTFVWSLDSELWPMIDCPQSCACEDRWDPPIERRYGSENSAMTDSYKTALYDSSSSYTNDNLGDNGTADIIVTENIDSSRPTNITNSHDNVTRQEPTGTQGNNSRSDSSFGDTRAGHGGNASTSFPNVNDNPDDVTKARHYGNQVNSSNNFTRAKRDTDHYSNATDFHTNASEPRFDVHYHHSKLNGRTNNTGYHSYIPNIRDDGGHESVDSNQEHISGKAVTKRKYVTCNHSNLTFLPEIPADVEVLEISDSKLTSIDSLSHILQFGKLQNVNLSRNEIANMAVIGQTGTRINTLDLSYNRITGLSAACLENARKLRYLHLSNNLIDHIRPDTLLGNEDLVRLDLSFNRLRSPHCGVFHRLRQLRFLSLRGNMIDAVQRRCFYRLDLLETLDLSRNYITRIAKSAFNDIPNLKRLYLQNNLLTSIPTVAIQCFVCLNLIDLSNNSFESINSYDFTRTNVNTIYLKFETNLRYIDKNSFSESPMLTVLNVSDNVELSFVHSSSFNGVLNLQRLDLSRNNLQHVSVDTIQNMTSLEYFNLAGNPLSDGECTRRSTFNRRVERNNTIHEDGKLMLFGSLDKSPLDYLRNHTEGSSQCSPKIVRTFLQNLYTIYVGESVKLMCLVNGSPMPEITWYHNNQMCISSENPNEYFVAKKSHIVLPYSLRVSQRGLYTCMAKNSIGVDTVCVEVNVKRNTASVAVLKTMASSLIITWHGLESNMRYKVIIWVGNFTISKIIELRNLTNVNCEENHKFTPLNKTLTPDKNQILMCYINDKGTNLTLDLGEVNHPQNLNICITFAHDTHNTYINCIDVKFDNLHKSEFTNVAKVLVFAIVCGCVFIIILLIASVYHIRSFGCNSGALYSPVSKCTSSENLTA